MENQEIINEEKGNDVNHVLATADKLAAHYEWLLANFYISKKSEGWGYNVNDARPEAIKIIDTYKQQRKGCC